MRVGFVGTENSHVKHFIRFLNLDQRHPGYRAVALAGGHSDHNEELARYGGLDLIVQDSSELVGQVDAAIVCNRDGGLHRAATEPLLRAGIPVLVDKPLATTVDDAEAILQQAEECAALLFSASALRFVPEVEEFAAQADDPIRHLHVAGPADPDSEYAGLFFYGIHHVETALEILGNPVVDPEDVAVRAQRYGDLVRAEIMIDGRLVTLSFVTPSGGGQVPFHTTAIRTRAVHARNLTLGPDYNAATLARFVTAIERGRSPLSREQLLTPVAILAAIAERI